jgi:hypothetical protein
MSYKMYKHLIVSNYRKLAETIKSITKPKKYDKSKKKKD